MAAPVGATVRTKVAASMGPRPNGRGWMEGSTRGISRTVPLQWGRDLTDADGPEGMPQLMRQPPSFNGAAT